MSEDSSPMGLDSDNHGVSRFDFNRLERKVDRMADALNTLIRVEERQLNQGARLGDVETEVAVNKAALEASEKKLDQWINRGIGMWMFAALLWGAFKVFYR